MDPPKSAIVNGVAGIEPFPGSARANVFRTEEPGVWKLTVSLDDKRVLTSQRFPSARPMIQLEQFMAIEAWVKADPRFIAACAARGITDMGQRLRRSLVCRKFRQSGRGRPPSLPYLRLAAPL